MALFRNGKPNIKALARDGDADGLVAAAGYQDLIPAAGGGTADRGVHVRQEAILALGALGPERGADAVRGALSDPSDDVRVAAIRVLYARKEATAIATALAFLPAGHGQARPLALRAVAELRRSESAPAVAAALVRAPAAVDDAGITLLTQLLDADEGTDATGEVVEELLQALADENGEVADRAEELLALLAPASTEGVIAELASGTVPHRAAAVLARIKDTRALRPLMAALTHRDARVRAESATALGELRDPAAVEALIHATRDPEHRVRAQAGWALDRLGTVAVVVGVSTLIRPMILEAVAAPEPHPALPEADEDGSPAPDQAGQQVLERLLAAVDDVNGAEEGPS